MGRALGLSLLNPDGRAAGLSPFSPVASVLGVLNVAWASLRTEYHCLSNHCILHACVCHVSVLHGRSAASSWLRKSMTAAAHIFEAHLSMSCVHTGATSNSSKYHLSPHANNTIYKVGVMQQHTVSNLREAAKLHWSPQILHGQLRLCSHL